MSQFELCYIEKFGGPTREKIFYLTFHQHFALLRLRVSNRSQRVRVQQPIRVVETTCLRFIRFTIVHAVFFIRDTVDFQLVLSQNISSNLTSFVP